MPLKLLIIHSDDPFREHLLERMRLQNYLVFGASPEDEAFDMIQKTNFDVVVLGATGPHEKSLALLKMIKAIRPLTEVILLTTLEDHSLYGSMQAMQLGAFDQLLVPLDIPTLHTRIQEAYKHKKERVKAGRSSDTKARSP